MPKKTLKKYCILNKKEDILDDWDSLKNTISPDDVTKTSSKEVWWNCSICGYKWSGKVVRRVSSGCPECSKRKKSEKLLDYKKKTLRCVEVKKNIKKEPDNSYEKVKEQAQRYLKKTVSIANREEHSNIIQSKTHELGKNQMDIVDYLKEAAIELGYKLK